MQQRFLCLKTISEGWMAKVMLVWDQKRCCCCIFKKASPHNAWAKMSIQMEIRLLRSLTHPMIPPLLESFEEEGALLLPYIKGETLAECFARKGPFDDKQILCWGIALCEVLSYLHGQQPMIIYRDLKPDNVIVTKNGSLMLIDFGAARLYQENKKSDTLCLGTKGFAAPEQYGGMGQSDVRSDVYALGALLFHLWDRKEDKLKMILVRCLQYLPEHRYQSCAEVKRALQAVQNKRRRRFIHFFSTGNGIIGCWIFLHLL